MSTSAEPTSEPHDAEPAAPAELRVSAYDRVSSMVIALVSLLGVTVAILLAVWLGSRVLARQTAVPFEMVDLGTGTGSLGEGMELETPDMDQIGQEVDIEKPEVVETLAIVADAVASKELALEDPMLIQGPRGSSRGTGRGIGGGTGTGAGQRRRWEVEFNQATLEVYARQLDFFGIEMGVLLPGNQVQLVSGFAQPRPAVRTAVADQEKRYYLTWRRGELEQADRELLVKAGVKPEGRLIVKFLPPQVEGTLAQLERTRAGDRFKDLQSTRFGVRAEGAGFAFFVSDQEFR